MVTGGAKSEGRHGDHGANTSRDATKWRRGTAKAGTTLPVPFGATAAPLGGATHKKGSNVTRARSTSATLGCQGRVPRGGIQRGPVTVHAGLWEASPSPQRGAAPGKKAPTTERTGQLKLLPPC